MSDTRGTASPLPRSVDGHDQYPALSAGPGPPPVHPDAEHDSGHGGRRQTAAGTGLAAVRDGRAAGGQRPQAGHGRQRPACGRPPDRNLPQWPGVPARGLPEVRPAALRQDPGTGRGRRPGPGRHPGGVRQQEQGLLPEGLAAGDRPVLQARPDAAGLRGTPLPPPDHAGGLHPDPAGRLRRAHRPRCRGGGRRRLGDQ